MTLNELAGFIRIKPATIVKWIARKPDDIPHRKIGEVLVFDVGEIDAWITSCAVPAKPPKPCQSRIDFTNRRLMEEAYRVYREAIKDGSLVRPAACSRCGAKPSQSIHGHHRDYSRPLDVVWLCSKCHGHERRHS